MSEVENILSTAAIRKLVAPLEKAAVFLSRLATKGDEEAGEISREIVAAWNEARGQKNEPWGVLCGIPIFTAKVENSHAPNVLGSNVGTTTPALSFPADGNPYSDLPLSAQEGDSEVKALEEAAQPEKKLPRGGWF